MMGGRVVRIRLDQRLYSITGVAASPDGTMVAVSEGGGEFPPRNIFVMRADGSGLRQLTHGTYYEVAPSWSPDGKYLVFSSTRCCATEQDSGSYALYTIKPNGTGLHRVMTDPMMDVNPAWSPDGRGIAYIRIPKNGGSWSVWLVNTDGTRPHALTRDKRINDAVTWSPDGQHLAYTSHLIDDRDWQVRVINVDGSHVHTVFSCRDRCRSGGYTLAWSPDGQQIAFTINTGSRTNPRPRIAVVNPHGGEYHQLDTHEVGACCLSWIPRARDA